MKLNDLTAVQPDGCLLLDHNVSIDPVVTDLTSGHFIINTYESYILTILFVKENNQVKWLAEKIVIQPSKLLPQVPLLTMYTSMEGCDT